MVFIIISTLLILFYISYVYKNRNNQKSDHASIFLLCLLFNVVALSICMFITIASMNKKTITEEEITKLEILDNKLLINDNLYNLSSITLVNSEEKKIITILTTNNINKIWVPFKLEESKIIVKININNLLNE